MPSASWVFLNTFRRSHPGVGGWEYLKTFNIATLRDTQALGWERVQSWGSSLHAMVDDLKKAAVAQLVDWHEALAPLGGDPAEHDWSGFRPLRTSREEDWSDWLQHLLATSQTGTFAGVLFDGIMPNDANLRDSRVLREISSQDGERRADVVILWKGEIATHIEVKVGDQSFEKTFETCRLLTRDFPEVSEWRHLILLPDADRPTWFECRDDYGKEGPEVFDLTWNRVAVALRAALRSEGENLSWRTWAWTYCGAIEQRLLGIPRLGKGCSVKVGTQHGPPLASFLEILAQARKAEPCKNR